VQVVRHICEIDATDWDSVLGQDDLQATHRFVSACEESGIEQAEYRHILIRRTGAVAAIATFSAFSVPLDVLATGFARRAIGAVRQLWPSVLRVPVVFGGLPVSFGASCLRFAAGVNTDEVLPLICAVAEQFAVETHARVVCFKEFSTLESEVLAGLTAHGFFRAPSLPACRLELRWRDFDEYLASMRAKYRRQVRATVAARAHAGLTIRAVVDVGVEAERLHALYDEVIAKAEVKLETLPPEFFRRLHQHLPGESRAMIVEQHGAPVAMAVVLDAPTITTWLLVGMAYDKLRETSAYHAVVLEVIAHALSRGATALEMGQTSYDLKGRLGARTAARELYVRYRSPIGHWLLRAARGALFPVVRTAPRRVFRDE
jgi:predicted N-acyltransferase